MYNKHMLAIRAQIHFSNTLTVFHLIFLSVTTSQHPFTPNLPKLHFPYFLDLLTSHNKNNKHVDTT